MRRRTSARFFPKKGCSVRLDVGEKAVALNIREALGSLKANLSRKKLLGRTSCGFVFQAAFAVVRKQKNLAVCWQGFVWCGSTPKGIRTPVAAVKGKCPRPLDDGRGKARIIRRW